WPDWKRIMLVVAIFLIGQFIEGNVVSPKFVGERVGLHPVWLIFAMFAFGYLFGFVGLLIAVPLGAAIAVLLRFGLRQYFASPLYPGKKRIGGPPLRVNSHLRSITQKVLRARISSAGPRTRWRLRSSTRGLLGRIER